MPTLKRPAGSQDQQHAKRCQSFPRCEFCQNAGAQRRVRSKCFRDGVSIASCYGLAACVNKYSAINCWGALKVALATEEPSDRDRDSMTLGDPMPCSVDDAHLEGLESICLADDTWARDMADATGVVACRFRFFQSLGTLLEVRLLMKVSLLKAWPLCCLRRSCPEPMDVQTIFRQAHATTIPDDKHEWCSLQELFNTFMPRFVTAELGVNNVIEEFDATNIVLDWLIVDRSAPGKPRAWQVQQMLFVAFLAKGVFNQCHWLLCMCAFYDLGETIGELQLRGPWEGMTFRCVPWGCDLRRLATAIWQTFVLNNYRQPRTGYNVGAHVATTKQRELFEHDFGDWVRSEDFLRLPIKYRHVLAQLHEFQGLLRTMTSPTQCLLDGPKIFAIGRNLIYDNVMKTISRHAELLPENTLHFLKHRPFVVGPGAIPFWVPEAVRSRSASAPAARMAYKASVHHVAKASYVCSLTATKSWTSSQLFPDACLLTPQGRQFHSCECGRTAAAAVSQHPRQHGDCASRSGIVSDLGNLVLSRQQRLASKLLGFDVTS